jgi:hypothetical protein
MQRWPHTHFLRRMRIWGKRYKVRPITAVADVIELVPGLLNDLTSWKSLTKREIQRRWRPDRQFVIYCSTSWSESVGWPARCKPYHSAWTIVTPFRYIYIYSPTCTITGLESRPKSLDNCSYHISSYHEIDMNILWTTKRHGIAL